MSENCNYAPVEKVILIDDRRIVIMHRSKKSF